MLAQAVMPVVIALAEINNARHVGVRDGDEYSPWGLGVIKCHRDELMGNHEMKRGKPHKRET